MNLILYIKDSIGKFRKDALSKSIYDLIRALAYTFLATSGITFASIWLHFLDFIRFPVTIQVFILILVVLSISAITALIINNRFRKKYDALKLDNYTDELTGLKNYKALKTHLTKLIENRTDVPLSLILMDVDDFKKFNTKTGYQVADLVLKKLGELLGNDKRATDEIFRVFLRGDEFMIIAENTNQNQAFIASERKRELINNHGFEVNGNVYTLTVSCGVTEFISDDDYTSFTDRVNKALNLAKLVKNKNCTKSLN